ncbi:Hsp70 family protein [Streptomyces macrosporus]|uniref:Molecular chaperone DnaK n=1 Tax=Streptomyces macrosporus TaxID=44032 RepID=A0ABP5WLX5_9ACTN
MRDTIDFGIDLGTTNSAIAVVEDGESVVIKNIHGSDTTPSAVWMPKAGTVHVGLNAKNHVEKDPDNAVAEFKQEMGLADARRTFARAGVSLTPQELSAEVLKSLRADAAHKYQGVAPDAAVITVPAAFALNQNKATSQAAALAGFSPDCPLVQEPTAAAFAYGFQDHGDRAYWMVFDFGGGTFDAAVVSKRDGDLRVLNHAGDSYLGGKLIDWALVERVLAPAVGRELGRRDFRRDNPAWRAAFAALKAAAEEAKINLSRLERVDITVELIGENREVEIFEYGLTRGELDAVAAPFYTRAVNLCRTALEEASLRPDDIDRLLLVGGITLSPGLRERLADPRHGMGIPLETRIDPTTVVARGAALFASTVRRPRSALPTAAPGAFTAELAYEPSVTTTTATVAGRLSGPSPVEWTGYSVTLSNPEGRPPFHSGRIPLGANGAFVAEVDLDPQRTSRFTVELTDATGTPRPLTPDTVSITHRDVEFGGARLQHSLGIQLADRAFAPLVRKGTTLPTRVREVFHTSSALLRAEDDAVLRIPIVQGEHDRADRNRQVGMLEIRPRDVRIDLPPGTEVEVTFEVDTSSLVAVVADVPLVQTQFEAEIDLDDVRTPDADALRAALDEAEERLASLRGTAASGDSPDARRRLDRLEEEDALTTVREQVRAASVDAGAAVTAEERLRDLYAELDDIEAAAELPVLVGELRRLLDEASALVDAAGTAADRRELTDLRERTRDAAAAEDAAAVRRLTERAGTLLLELERRGPDWPVKLFHALREAVPPSRQVDSLVGEGMRAIAAGDRHGLDGVNQRLIRLLPRDAQDRIIGLVKQ